MSKYEMGDLICSIINTLIAIFSIWTATRINKKKKEIDDKIKEFKKMITKNNNLKELGVIQEELRGLQKRLRKLALIKKGDKTFDRDEIIENYDKIIDKLDEMKNRLSTQYSKIETDIISIRNTLSKCISDNELLNEKERGEQDYNSIDAIFDSVLRIIKKELESMTMR